MAGISEILFLLLLLVCVLILPRFFKGEPAKKVSPLKKRTLLSAKIRFAIVITIVYPVILALFMKPWNKAPLPYISFGILPVFLAWAVAWAIAGKNK